jgi:hypothetical protein
VAGRPKRHINHQEHADCERIEGQSAHVPSIGRHPDRLEPRWFAILVAMLILLHEHDYGAAFGLSLVIVVWAVLDLVIWLVRGHRSA